MPAQMLEGVMFAAMQRFREKLDDGRLCLGAGISLADPGVTEALADSVDFVWIDVEHSAIGVESLLGHLIAAKAGGTAALVRIPTLDVGWIKRVLDSGAPGIIVPQIRSADEVRGVVAACRYPPAGQRGFGPRRPSNYGRLAGPEYLKMANESVFVCVQIETAEALRDVEAIVAVPGLDAIAIGPADLSGAMGLPGQLRDPRVTEAVRTIVSKARQAGKYVGIGMGPDAEYALEAARLGVQWVQCGGDYSYMLSCVDRLFGEIRNRLAKA
jgi:2-keto-3-deoxy-L-rhamnonate aldolase RhmA